MNNFFPGPGRRALELAKAYRAGLFGHKPSAPPSPQPSSRSFPVLLRISRSTYYVVGGIFVGGITNYTIYLLTPSNNPPSTDDLPSQDTDVSSVYDSTAQQFDNCVTWSEFISGINSQRRRLARQAKGHVLEVSVGTGRNAKYYNLDYTWSDWFANTRYAELQRRKAAQVESGKLDEEMGLQTKAHGRAPIDDGDSTISPWVKARPKDAKSTYTKLKKKSTEVSSLTFVDVSAPMVEVARKKFERKYPGYGPVQFLTQSALGPLPSNHITDLARKQGGFDFVLQSMGLCSTPEPVQLLKHLGELAHPERGRILLLEHGRGNWGWINDRLDLAAPWHAKKHGCWYNRDIGKIVEESGLVVEKCKRKHLGTLWVIEARPRSKKEIEEQRAYKDNEKHVGSQRPSVIVQSKVDMEGVNESVATASKPGLTTRVWSSLKTLTGMDTMKDEDPGRDEKKSHKDD